MGFRDIRQKAIDALIQGNIQHEIHREEIDVKNLLLTGVVSPEHVIQLLHACRGGDYQHSPHHIDASIDVHIFKPVAKIHPNTEKKRWYIKLYFLDPDAIFISVHQSK